VNRCIHGKKNGRLGVISFFFNAAFLAFFVSTGALLWLFLITNSWVRLTPEDQAELLATVAQPTTADPNATAWNPEVILTTRGVHAVRCTNPYQYHIQDMRDNGYGIGVTIVATLIILGCVVVLIWIPRHVATRFDPKELKKNSNLPWPSTALPLITDLPPASHRPPTNLPLTSH